MNYNESYNKILNIICEYSEDNPIDPNSDIENNPECWYSINNQMRDISLNIFNKIIEDLVNIGSIKIHMVGSLPLASTDSDFLFDRHGNIAPDPETLEINFSVIDKTKIESKLDEIARNIRNERSSIIFSGDNFEFLANGTTTFNGSEFEIRRQLQDILIYFITNKDILLNTNQIQQHIYIKNNEESLPTQNSVKKYINKINKILEPIIGHEPLSNIYGRGWIFKTT